MLSLQCKGQRSLQMLPLLLPPRHASVVLLL
jgi:hypothetical protein